MHGKPQIFVTRRLPEAVEARLRQDYDPRLNEHDVPLPPETIPTAATGAQGLIVTPTDRLDASVIMSLPESVKIISTFSVGYEHIDCAAAHARGITVTNTPGVLTEATADLALLLILGAARRASEGERMIRANAWSGWAPTQLLGTHLGGRTLGILGMGRIGQAVAHRARAFGLKVHYHNRHRLAADQEFGAEYHVTAEGLLAVSDILSLHFPATPDTRKFLNRDRLSLLPSGAIVINTARGAVVDDEALIAALKSGHLAAAGLDVFDGEPHLNAGYRALENTFLLPHLGSATTETRNAMGFMALDNLDAYFAGTSPPNSVK